jgi:radical SAM protein with 4Fe4S-binding SPASM domain
MKSKITPQILFKLAKCPSVLDFAVRGLIRHNLTVNLHYNRKDNVSPPPLAYNLKITNACNLRCKMCAQWGEHGYNFTRPTSEIKQIVPLETYKKMIDDIKHLRPAIYIWGGEPFLYPPLMELMEYIKKNKLVLELVTNGVKLEENAEQLVDLGLEGLMVSVDGPRDIHDEVRGVKGTFDKLMSGLQQVKEFKKKKKKNYPNIVFFSTICKENSDYFDKITEVGEAIGIDMMVIYPSWFTTEEIGKKHTEIMEKELGCTPFTWKGYVNSFSEEHIASIAAAVKRIRRQKFSFPIMWLPNLEEHEVEQYYREPHQTFNYKRCIAPWLMTEIMPNGDVVPCRDYSDYVVGNIAQKSIIDIYNDEGYRKFRGLLKKHGGLIPICARCCGLMGY